jgi:hypothetical protein
VDVNVLPLPQPAIQAAGPLSFCAALGEQVLLDADPGYLTYEWAEGGAPIPGANGQSYRATAGGTYTVTVTDADGCAGTSAVVTLNGNDCTPGEVSSQAEGERPLRVRPRGPAVTVEPERRATAYNVYSDALGSWYAPTTATGSVCWIQTWTTNPDGTLDLDWAAPAGSWFVVTASNPFGEGPAGPTSGGQERTILGTWALCGAVP